MLQVFLISLLSGLATGLGGLIVVWFGHPSKKLLSFYLGISASMMGLVVLVDLLPASFQYGSGFHTFIGLMIGISMMLIFDKMLHKSFYKERLDGYNSLYENKFYRSLGYFMTLAIALHNIPEGLAIGAGFENQEELGIRVALVIALHNIPEGLGVASTLLLGEIPVLLVILLPLATGLFIPMGTLASSLLGKMMPDWISIGLSIASGAMIYIVLKDVGPESLKLNKIIGQFGMAIGILILYITYRLHS